MLVINILMEDNRFGNFLKGESTETLRTWVAGGERRGGGGLMLLGDYNETAGRQTKGHSVLL